MTCVTSPDALLRIGILLTIQCRVEPSSAIVCCSIRSIWPVRNARSNSCRSRPCGYFAKTLKTSRPIAESRGMPWIADLTMAVPRRDLVIAVDHVQRDRQSVQHRFVEFAVLFSGLCDRII